MKRFIFLFVFVLVFAINADSVSADGNFVWFDSSLGTSDINIAATGMETITFWRYFDDDIFQTNYVGSTGFGFYYQNNPSDNTIYLGMGTGSGTIELPFSDDWYKMNLEFDWDFGTATLTVDGGTGTITWTSFGEPSAEPFVFSGNGAIDSYVSSLEGSEDFELYSVGDPLWSGQVDDGTNSGYPEAPADGPPNNPPDFTSATDDDSGATIKGGSTLQITTVASDSDSETLIFRVCSTNSVTGSACSDTEYCNNIGLLTDPSCSFATQTD
ncbi:MAG: hypothetical protein KAI18_03860, partial [Candidatus Aenigmarchaeota archaeon]|nr:hypothetical protein [Candidatus Aenigmarchaeota archaeon]